MAIVANEKPHSLTHIWNMGFDQENQLPIVETVSLSPGGTVIRPMAGVTTLVDAVDASTTYIGSSEPGTTTTSALWRIQKILVSGSITTLSWADGNLNFDNIWDNRGSLTYS